MTITTEVEAAAAGAASLAADTAEAVAEEAATLAAPRGTSSTCADCHSESPKTTSPRYGFHVFFLVQALKLTTFYSIAVVQLRGRPGGDRAPLQQPGKAHRRGRRQLQIVSCRFPE